MKIEDNHYTYRIETKDPNGGSLDFIDIDTVEPLRCAYDVQDELNLETNEHIKRVEEIVLDANSTEFWYVDEARTSDTHLVCYFEEVELMANKDHPMVDTNRSVFEYGKINSNEHQNTNFICTHVMDNGVSRVYMSIDKTIFEFATFNNETIKHFISNNPVTVWYALRYEIIIPRSMSKGHLLTLSGQTDITLTTTSEQAKLPIMKFNIGDTQYTLDTNPIHINNTQEGTQIRNIVLEGNTPINYARGNGVNTTEQVSNTRYDFEPFYDGQTTIQGTVEGGYVSAKLYGDTMVNIAKPYGETPLLTATSESVLCNDLLGMNEEGIVLADGEITEGRIVGNSAIVGNAPIYTYGIELGTHDGVVNNRNTGDYVTKDLIPIPIPNKAFLFFAGNHTWSKCAVYDANESLVRMVRVDNQRAVLRVETTGGTYVRFSYHEGVASGYTEEPITYKYDDGSDVFAQEIQSVVNPTVYSVNENLVNPSLFRKGINITLIDGGVMVDGDTSVGWQSFYNNTTAIKLLANHTYKLRAFLLEGEYTGGVFKYSLSNNTAKEASYTNTFTITPTTDAYLTALSFYAPKGIGAKFGISLIETSNDLDTYIPYKSSQATFPYTLNKLPNGVADYIDVVNKVHVQRVGVGLLEQNDLTCTIYYKGSENDNYAHYYSSDYFQIARGSVEIICDKLPVLSSIDLTKGEGIMLGSSQNLDVVLDKSKLGDIPVKEYLASLNLTILYPLATPIYTPLTDEEIAQLPLSAYKDGYVNLSSDQLTPSFEFRMRASNRYQVDMLETGYYYLNAPVGNVKLGTANVDVQQMPCIVKVDNVGTGDSAYRLSTVDSFYKEVSLDYEEGYLNISNGTIAGIANGRWASDYIEIPLILRDTYIYIGSCEGVDFVFYDENKTYITGAAFGTIENNYKPCRVNARAKYIRLSGRNDRMKIDICSQPITLAKLPSHRIPISFTQGMKCGTDFGYWEGVKSARPTMFRTSNIDDAWKIVESSVIEDSNGIVLNRIESYYGDVFAEDEFDIATGKLTKRITMCTFDGSEDEDWTITDRSLTNTYVFSIRINNEGKEQFSTLVRNNKFVLEGGWRDFEHIWINEYDTIVFHIKKDRIGNLNVDNFKKWLQQNPITIYYELGVPEISYPKISLPQVKTVAKTALQCLCWGGYLNAQVKPSHLTYPVPSLVGNRTYTVVHNRKNITGSTKPIELNLGGTVVQLNDASSKTLVKTPSTLAHSNLIFIGGESTVDHVMVLDGDWTNKPIEYFENMMGHDTDAIITIIGNGQIDDVEEQYLW